MNAYENPRVFVKSKDGVEPKALFMGLYGPSGSGKTYSALRVASGIQSVFGGEIAVLDTEADRARHYMPPFKFEHYSFSAPYRSVDYLAALRQLVAGGARTIIVDSMSHEHSGPGGVCEAHDAIVAEKGQSYTFTAWRIAKVGRKQLITAMTTEFKGCAFIFCFRAKDATDFEKKPPLKLGWMPISDDDFLFEMSLCALLEPGSEGAPTFKSGMPGERQYLKLPIQFRALFQQREPLSESTGRALAEWARGGTPSPSVPQTAAGRPAPSQHSPEADEGAGGELVLPDWTWAEYCDRWAVLCDEAQSAAQLRETWGSPWHKAMRAKIDPAQKQIDELMGVVRRRMQALANAAEGT